jgi:hypothetical protein
MIITKILICKRHVQFCRALPGALVQGDWAGLLWISETILAP